MESYNSNSEVHRPCFGAAASQRFDLDTTTVRSDSLGDAHGQCISSNPIMGGAQLAGVTVASVGGAVLDGGKSAEVKSAIAVETRKRGRPPRGQIAVNPPPPKRKREEEDEEDVCFICFDGGSLVLCDRKGCPKAYHPSCIKRDESFFNSTAKWNCGWHICSVCLKASHYKCYTCTYSLCKGCIRNANYFCVRGNKGFCPTCMRIVMLIENIDEANKEMVQVDFDDKTSWEYLFKVYWMFLKNKLSLTSNELIQAKTPWKEAVATQCKLQLANAHLYANDNNGVIGNSSEHVELKSCKEMGVIGKSSEHVELKNHEEREELAKKDSLIPENPNIAKPDNAHLHANDDKCVVGKSSEHVELKNHKGSEELAKKDPLISENPNIANLDNACIDISNENLGLTNPDGPQSKDMSGCANGSIMKGYTEWATKELLEFVGHMKNGDTSALSQSHVQKLLLDYIKRNHLRDPHKKSEIICDLRLKNLFGKSRLGHIEMLKLIEFHFLIKEDIQNNAFIPAGIVDGSSNHLATDESHINSSLGNKNKRRKACKKGEEKAPQISLDEYAAIDAHNISLIYLRRSLMENLINDVEKFHDHVVGSIVRIKISGNEQKQDMYRLVQVVGTCKVATPYKIGEKTADIMLEILNLDKKEAVSIDTISNQEFSQDECRRLCQCIKCGLVKRMTVGEIQKKAMELRPVKLNEFLEAEILRLGHLRDRASENGRKKDLRECIEKLQRLKTPEERHRRMLEIPEVHADPKMNPNYESEKGPGPSDDKKQDENLSQGNTGFNRNGSKQTPPIKNAKVQPIVIALVAQRRPNEKVDTPRVHSLRKRHNQACTSSSVISGQIDEAVVRCGPETSIASSSIASPIPPIDTETEKLWHYRDPNGNIQGPFSVMQLRRWNKTGLFPPDMRVWASDEHNESVLLREVLHGQSQKASENLDSATVEGEGLEEALDDRGHNVGWPNAVVKESEGNHSNAELSPRPSMQCLNLLNGDSLCSDKPQECSVPPSSSEGQMQADAQEERGHSCDNLQTSTGQENQEPWDDAVSHPTETINHVMQSNGQSFIDQLFGENWGTLESLPITDSKDMSSGAHFVSVTKSSDSAEQNGATNLSELPSPTPKSNYESWEVQAAKELLSLSSDFPFQRSHVQDLSSPPPKATSEDQHGHTIETEDHLPSNIPVQDSSGPSQSTACSLVVDGAQLPEGWGGGNSPTPKPSIHDWDPSLVSVSALRPLELVLGDQVATPASNPDHLTQSSPPSNVIEFSTLAEESVSDLLAEVDAMESKAQSGLGSPTSAMRCSVELMLWSKSDCFSSIDELNSAPDPAKNDAYSSTDIQLRCQLPATNELARGIQTDGFDLSRRCNGHSSTSSEGETKSTDVSFNWGDSGSEIHPPVPWATPGNVNYGPSQSVQGYANPGIRQAWRNPSMNRDAFNENVVPDNQRRHTERFPSPRDWASQGGNDRGRPSWNRQPVTGGGGGYSRPPPKAQRVCKFYESGRCKKGASCEYLHL